MNQMIMTSVPLTELCELLTGIVKKEMATHQPYSAYSTQATDAGANNELITRKDAAQLLGVSLPTLHRWTQDGTLTGYRLNTRVRYKRNELEKCLKTICAHNQKTEA